MGPTWVLSTPDGTHVVPMNLVIRERKAAYMNPSVTTKKSHTRTIFYLITIEAQCSSGWLQGNMLQGEYDFKQCKYTYSCKSMEEKALVGYMS